MNVREYQGVCCQCQRKGPVRKDFDGYIVMDYHIAFGMITCAGEGTEPQAVLEKKDK